MHRIVSNGVLLICLTMLLGFSASAGSYVYLAFYQFESIYMAKRAVDAQPGPELAVAYLMLGPTPEEEAAGVTTKIPKSWTIQSAYEEDGYFIINLGGVESDIHYPDALLDDIILQFDRTIYPYGLNVRLMVRGEPISTLRYPMPEIKQQHIEPQIQQQPMAQGALSGKVICISAGHGYYWSGSSWLTQRPITCGDLQQEDFRNVDHAILLKAYLQAEGATVIDTREMDKNRGMSPYGRHWWQMAAPPYLHDKGYPAWVYAPYTGVAPGTPGVDQRDEDRRTRPIVSNYHKAHAFISLHTNASSGGCYGSSCPSGIEMYHSSEKVGTASYDYANILQDACSAAVKTYFNPAFPCRNACNPRDSAFTEIYYPDAPACLLEFGFHDSCDLDAFWMRDPLFASAGMYGIYKGICQYFGVQPTYGGYSAEYVSDDIPSVVTQGETRTVNITFRNRGVSWTEAHQFRLGAVDDSDPFASTRQTISGTVIPGQTYTFTFNMTFLGTGYQTTDWRMVRDGVTWFGDTLTKTVYVAPSGDTQAPSVPQNLRITAAGPNSISLAWDASTDNIGVLGYRVYRNGAVLNTTPNTSYTDTGLSPNTTYNYQVEAYDAVPNYSGLSAVLPALTVASVFADGFNGNLDNWIIDPVNGSGALQYSTARNHGSIVGAGSAYSPATTANFMYHWLDSSTQSLTTGGYKTGMLSGWLFDTSGSGGNMRTGLRLYAYDSAGTNRAIYWVGVYSGTNPSQYVGAVFDGSGWTYYPLGPRTADWHKLSIEVLPYTGSNDIRFYLDGNVAATASQPPGAANATLKRVYMGLQYTANGDHYFDDITFDSAAPAAPSGLSGSGISQSSIRWSFTDNANNEIGYRVYDGSTMKIQREQANVSYVDEDGLAPNTIYTRTIKAYAGALESPSSASVSGCTLSIPPTTANVVCNRPAGVWQSQSPFTFTAVGGFGAGKVAYYRYVWDQQPTHEWDGMEWTWITSMISFSPEPSANAWYFHVQGLNQYEQPNGTLDLGPYYFDNTPPTQPVVTDDGEYSSSVDTLHASWTCADGESDIKSYEYAIGTSPASTDVVDWTAVEPPLATEITRSGLPLEEGKSYFISVRATNNAGLISSVGVSDGIEPMIEGISILQAKRLADGAEVKLSERIVSAAYDGIFYVQEPDRSSGIRVKYGQPLYPGARVDVLGRMSTINGERYIVATHVDMKM